MSVINISSNEQFNTLLSSSRVVVADCESATPRGKDPASHHNKR
jgi:hypothetical protein